jgi:hypothetical protein
VAPTEQPSRLKSIKEKFMMTSYSSPGPPHPASRAETAGPRPRKGGGGRKTSRILTVSAVLAAALFALSSPPRLPGGGGGGVLAASAEIVTVFADDCSTPKTTFYLGETVCAVVEGALPPTAEGWRQRSFQWVTPNQWVGQQSEILKEAQKELYTIPASGDFARVGKWSVRTVDNEPGTQTTTYFVVRDPRVRYADLALELRGPAAINPGDRLQHEVLISNLGPDYAKGVEFLVNVPTETVFVALKQVSGNLFDCTTPPRGETGKVICKGDYLKMDEQAEFVLYYQVNSDARDDAISESTGEIYNYSVEEASKEDNGATLKATVIIPREDGGDLGEQP